MKSRLFRITPQLYKEKFEEKIKELAAQNTDDPECREDITDYFRSLGWEKCYIREHLAFVLKQRCGELVHLRKEVKKENCADLEGNVFNTKLK